MIALPMVPVDSVSKTLVFSLQVKTIEIGVMTGAVPPGSFKPSCTILAPSVVISVNCAELRPFLRQTFTKLTINVSIDDPELVKLSADDEIVNRNLGRVSIPVL